MNKIFPYEFYTRRILCPSSHL